MNTKRLLVTGSNRSGSTWLGNVLAASGKVDIIIEPLNPNRYNRYQKSTLPYWYLKMNDTISESLKNNIHKTIDSYLSIQYQTAFTNFFTAYENHSLTTSFYKRIRKASKPIKLMKDPTALFSAPWLVDNFQLSPIVIIRHPAAYVLSIKEKNWWFDFSNLVEQEYFFEGPLSVFKEEVIAFQKEASTKDIIENASLFWKLCYAQVLYYKEVFPEWCYVKHEDLSTHPFEEFAKVFEYAGVPFNDQAKAYISKTTHSDTNTRFTRNSSQNATKWQTQLNTDEITRIHSYTQVIADSFYEPLKG